MPEEKPKYGGKRTGWGYKSDSEHGGARGGAGRKATGKSERVTVSVTPDLEEGDLLTGAEIKKAALWALAHGYKKEEKSP